MLITNGTVITWDNPNQIISDGAVYLDGATIGAVGSARELEARYPDAERLDARGQLIMPGLICAHTHFYGAYARGLAIPGEPPRDFPAILARLWWNLDKALDADSVRASALVCLVDAVRHGCTTLFDHHASPNFIDGSLDVIAECVEHAGLRAVLCYEVTDRDGLGKAHAGIGENIRFIKARRDHPTVRATFGLHASLTLSAETLRFCADASERDTGFHIHVAEHEADEADSLGKASKRVVHRLNDHGMLRPKTILAHCVHIDNSERAVIQHHNTWVTHQPRSNMNNAVGAMAFDDMMRQGIRICLGNDGFSNAMWNEWKDAYLLHKMVHRDPRLANGADIVQAGIYHNAALASQFFGAPVGVLAAGARADVILVDYAPFTPLTTGNLPWHILFGFESSMVTTTICEGQVLMRDRQFTTLDASAIVEWAGDLAAGVWERYAAYARA
jgi:putative selenium metabolism protein SsnA